MTTPLAQATTSHCHALERRHQSLLDDSAENSEILDRFFGGFQAL
jgi:hypothetical protein